MIDAVNELRLSCLHSTARLICRGIRAADVAGERPYRKRKPKAKKDR